MHIGIFIMVFIMSRLIGSNALRLLGRRGISISNVSPVKPLPPRVPRTSVAQTLPLEGKAPPMKKYIDGGYRINKCLGDLSRRAADEAIEGGRVTINGRRAQSGLKVVPGDVVRLDGRLQHWEDRFEAANRSVEIDPLKRDFIYVKYFKPVGVTCTSELKDRDNIIEAGGFDKFPQRMFTVGRLDKDSSGLILLTSDGRVNNALLDKSARQTKEYLVCVDKKVTSKQLEMLRTGVVIETPLQREENRMITARTLPAIVEVLEEDTRDPHINALLASTDSPEILSIKLIEGRNRQIRRMTESVGLFVRGLRRIEFAGISLEGLSEGEWKDLSADEVKLLNSAMRRRVEE